MNRIVRAVALLGLALLAACRAEMATPAVLEEFSFSTPCADLRQFFSSRGIQTRGDPLREDQQLTIFVEHPMFRVAEIRCARLKTASGDVEPMPAELTFFSGGEDTNARLTQGTLTLRERLDGSLGAPWKHLQTGRWEAHDWSGRPTLVRAFKNGPQDTTWVRVLFSRYPSNEPALLDDQLDAFLKILQTEELAPFAEK